MKHTFVLNSFTCKVLAGVPNDVIHVYNHLEFQ